MKRVKKLDVWDIKLIMLSAAICVSDLASSNDLGCKYSLGVVLGRNDNPCIKTYQKSLV